MVTCAVFRGVDVEAGAHLGALFLQACSTGEIEQHVHGLRQHALATVVEKDAVVFRSQGEATLRVLHQSAQMCAFHVLGMFFQTLPLSGVTDHC